MIRNALRTFLTLSLIFLMCSCGSSGDGSFTYTPIGASDATGIGASPLTNGYVFRIRDRLEEITSGVEFRNLGIPAAQVEQFVDVELPIAKELEPDLVTIWAGPNDIVAGESVANFRSELDELLSELQQDTPALVVIGTIPDLTQLPKFQNDPDPDVTVARVQAYNDVIRELASKYSAQIADLAQISPAEELVNDADGFHPNDEGHQLMAEIFLGVIEPLVSE